MKEKSDFSSLRKINKLIDTKCKILYIAGLIGIAGTYAANQILASFINKNILDAAINMSKSDMLTAFLMAIVLLGCACIINPVSVFIFDYSVRGAMIGIQKKILERLHKLPVSYYYKNHSGDILSRVNSSVNSIEQAYSMHLFRFCEAAIWGVGSLISMIVLDWRLTLIMVVYSLVVLYLNSLFTDKVRAVEDKLQVINAKNIEIYEEILKGIRIIKTFGIRKELYEKFEKSNEAYKNSKILRAKYDSQISVMNFAFTKLSLFLLIIVGGYMAFRGEVSFGSILAIIGLQNGIANMFSNIGSIINDLQGAWAGGSRIFEIFNEKTEFTDKGNMLEKEIDKPAILMKNINFSYGDKNTLCNIDFEVKKGENVALIGESGSGKSTLVKLLLGFYDINDGKINMFGNSSDIVSKNEWRKNISYVSQNAILFEGSVKDNISYGNQNASEEMIIEAAKKANAYEFISQLEGGYNYNVGENGKNLSGGQKQRIALARAILKDADIIIIDEGTSALDKESEVLVQKSINSLKGELAIIQITHNLNMVKEADKIYLIKDGWMDACGIPQEIIG